MLETSGLYIGLSALLYILLAGRIITQRHKTRISLGDGGDEELIKRIRAHGNFAEYTPLLLIMLVACELQGAPEGVLHILGATLLACRVLHAVFISMTPEPIVMRQLTMGSTFFLLAVMGLGLAGHAIF